MNDHVYPSDWDKPKFFFGQRVSLACLPDPYLWYGFIRGMCYSLIGKQWTYEVQIARASSLTDVPDIPEILIVWLEPNMIFFE
jgi:hypothetical protein